HAGLDLDLDVDPPPAYGLDLDTVLRQWRTSVDASREISSLLPIESQLQRELDAANAVWAGLKEKSSKQQRQAVSPVLASPTSIAKATSRSSSSNLPGSSASASASASAPVPTSASTSASETTAVAIGVERELARQPTRTRADDVFSGLDQREAVKAAFERAHAEEMKWYECEVEVREKKLAEMKRQKDALASVASAQDAAWAQLQHAAGGIALPPGSSLATQIGAACEDLSRADMALGLVGPPSPLVPFLSRSLSLYLRYSAGILASISRT
ncbi:hypothetical protein EW145_g8536, partial [Phellinidium pouzarii]